MQQPDHLIVGIHVRNRARHAGRIQKVLTAAGGNIRTRVGLHDVHAGASDNGLILIEFIGDARAQKAFVARLDRIHGVDVKSMRFPHD